MQKDTGKIGEMSPIEFDPKRAFFTCKYFWLGFPQLHGVCAGHQTILMGISS